MKTLKPEVFRLAQEFLSANHTNTFDRSGAHNGICTCILAACYTPDFDCLEDYGLHIQLANDYLKPEDASAYWWPYSATPADQEERFIALELLALIAEDLNHETPLP